MSKRISVSVMCGDGVRRDYRCDLADYQQACLEARVEGDDAAGMVDLPVAGGGSVTVNAKRLADAWVVSGDCPETGSVYVK